MMPRASGTGVVPFLLMSRQKRPRLKQNPAVIGIILRTAKNAPKAMRASQRVRERSSNGLKLVSANRSTWVMGDNATASSNAPRIDTVDRARRFLIALEMASIGSGLFSDVILSFFLLSLQHTNLAFFQKKNRCCS